MRPPRLVLVSTLLMSALITSDAQARPRLPGIFGAVLGAAGSIVGLRHRHYVRGHQEPRMASAPAQTATDSPAATPTGTNAPLFWPQLADDVFDYILWPSGKDDHLWAYGYDDLVEGALRPPSHERAPRRASARAMSVASAVDMPAACAARQGSESASALVERIEQTIQPTETQRAKLDELRTALQRAFEYIDKACPTDQPQTPTARLDTMEDRIWGGRQALLGIRAPLEQFYASLTDEQKARLNGPLVPSVPRGPGCRESRIDLPTMLTGGRSTQVAPTQRPAIDALRKTSSGLARLLATACPSAMPATPVERLDAADRRLNSMLYAVVTLRVPLDVFYASLTAEQKTQMGKLH
jgi:hypothetical protein